MANDIKLMRKIINKLLKNVQKSLKRGNIPTLIGKTSRDMVKQRTRSGFGIDKNEGKKQRLPKLAPNTKKIRKELKKEGNLSPETTPNRSNFTRSGKTLDNIEVRPKNSAVEVKLTQHGQNAVKETQSINKNYNFMGLSKKETNEIRKQIESEIQNVIKKFNK